MSILAHASGALGDNPVLDKDAGLLLRGKRAAAAWLFVAAGLGLVAVLAWLEADGRQNLRFSGGLNPAGGEMLVVLTGVMLAAINILLPALASTSITSERERGTLPLLLVSGLSPARLVVGKAAALLVAAAPFLAIGLPLIALCGLFLGVDVDSLLLAAVGIFVHAFAVVSVGVWASAACARTRSASLVALVAAGVPALFGGAPIMGALVACLDEQQHELLLVGVVGLAVDVLIGLAALLGAWSILSPRSAERWRPSRVLLLWATTGVPLLVAIVIALFARQRDSAALLFSEAVGVVVVAALLAVAVTGRRSGTPTPLKTALLAWSSGVVGLGAAFAAMLAMANDHIITGADVVAVVVVSLAVAGVAAFSARWMTGPVVVVVATVGVFSALFAVPAVIDEFVYGQPPLAFLNPAYVVARDDTSVVSMVLFYGAVAIVTLLGARGERRR